MENELQLRDGFGRVHDDLRISVTDRCNMRCTYCMPEEPVWFPRETILRYEEILRIVHVAVARGVRKVRLTGGEPLVRRDVALLVRMLADEPGIEDLSLTTNGLLLESRARELADAGLQRVNVSLDTLQPERFREVTRRDALDRVLDGLAAAAEAGLRPVKVNAVLVEGRNAHEAEALVRHARVHGWELRFIECMPLANGGSWEPAAVVDGEALRKRIEARWPLQARPGDDPHAPARTFDFRDGAGSVGFINSVSEPFCGRCSRLRLTADGRLRVCLYDDAEVDLRGPLRSGVDDAVLAELLVGALSGKGRGGALEILERGAALPLARTMHQIGG